MSKEKLISNLLVAALGLLVVVVLLDVALVIREVVITFF